MGPGGRGILKSSYRKAWILGISGLCLVIIVPAFTGTSYGSIKGLLSIINGDIYIGIFFKGVKRVVTDYKDTLNIVT